VADRVTQIAAAAEGRTAVVSSASLMEPLRLRATMEIRTRGANRLHGPDGQPSYRCCPAPVRPVRHGAMHSVQFTG
jgi:hypothetical protein